MCKVENNFEIPLKNFTVLSKSTKKFSTKLQIVVESRQKVLNVLKFYSQVWADIQHRFKTYGSCALKNVYIYFYFCNNINIYKELCHTVSNYKYVVSENV